MKLFIPIICIGCASLVAIMCNVIRRRIIFRGRELLSDDEIVRLFRVNDKGMMALRQLASLYGIKMGFLRPSDKLGSGGIMDDFNSWGTEYLNDFLAEHGVFEVKEGFSISDFVAWYCSYFRTTPEKLW